MPTATAERKLTAIARSGTSSTRETERPAARSRRAGWRPPCEPLPTDKRALRLRAVRDGLIISGWLATGFALVVVTSIAHSVGYDAYSYWSIDFGDLYGRAVASNFALGAFRYAPPIAFLFGPLAALPWGLFLWLWEALMLAL